MEKKKQIQYPGELDILIAEWFQLVKNVEEECDGSRKKGKKNRIC